jgi:hypothetical protein
MTGPAFAQKTFTVAQGPSEVPEEERRQQWDATFGNSCPVCAAKGWAQTPMRNKWCVVCGKYFCPEHLAEHTAQDSTP